MGIDSRTPVPTTKGWIPASHLMAGDEVFGYDGVPTKVTLVQEYEPHRMFKVRLRDGLSLNTDAKTGLPVYAKRTLRNLKRWTRAHPRAYQLEPMSAQTIVDDSHTHVHLLIGQPIKPAKLDLPIEPYEMGRWIMIAKLDTQQSQTHITRNLIERYATIPTLLPEEYLFASFEQRLALLRGIVSTRPRAFKKDKGRFEFLVKGLFLARQVQNLVESLGIRVTHAMTRDTRSGYYWLKFPTIIRLTDEQTPPPKLRDVECRKINKVEEILSRKCTHISVAAEHNSILVSEGYLPISL